MKDEHNTRSTCTSAFLCLGIKFHGSRLNFRIASKKTDPHSEHHDGLMLEVQEHCDGFSTKNEERGEGVGRCLSDPGNIHGCATYE